MLTCTLRKTWFAYSWSLITAGGTVSESDSRIVLISISYWTEEEVVTERKTLEISERSWEG